MADTLDVVVMGYDEGQGKRSKFGIGDFWQEYMIRLPINIIR